MASERRTLRAHVAMVTVFLYAPIAAVVAWSFNAGGSAGAWSGFSTQWYAALARDQVLLDALHNTVIVAGASTLVATVLGTLLALGLDKARRSPLLDAVAVMPMNVPDIVLAIALLAFFTLIRMTLGVHSIVIAHAVFNIALICAIVRTRLTHFDHTVIEASIDLGASETSTYWRIVLPAIFPGILGGALIAFTLSANEFVIATFTAGSLSATLPMHIYAMIGIGAAPEINAVATIVLGVSFALILLSQRINRATP